MATPLTASDLWPLILKLSHDERVRLAKLDLRAFAEDRADGSSYAAAQPSAEEFFTNEEPLAWYAKG